MKRFERQISLRGFGEAAQAKLQRAKVLVVGAGGLGCPALTYLAAAGVGFIGIADGDTVCASNLNRQTLFSEQDINKPKAETAGNHLKEKYSDIRLEIIPEFIASDKALSLISRYDLVIDGSDNFQTRYLINDACVLLKVPLVFGAVYQNEGQVAVFNIADENNFAANYRDVFQLPQSALDIPNCSQTGVLGVVPGLIGVLLAAEAIKIITGFGSPLANKLLLYNLLTASFYETLITPNETARQLIPKNFTEFMHADYHLPCQTSSACISWADALAQKALDPSGTLLLDVRELYEQPKLIADYLSVPLGSLSNNREELAAAETIFVFCQKGIRSRKAVEILARDFPLKRAYSINGGMESDELPPNLIRYEA